MNLRRHMVTSLFVLFGYFLLSESKTGPSHNKVVVCYISTWAVYRPGRGSFSIENVDPNLCTHLIYAFAGLDPAKDVIKSLDPWQDLTENYGKGGFERLTGLRQTYPHLKISLAIGGWNEGSKNYSVMAADPVKRRSFVNSVTEYILQHKFDGLDLDWEYPSQRGGEPHDKQNFVSLVKELRTSFKPHNLLLTSAFGAAKHVIDQAYDIRRLSKYLDYLHIMCYDYGGAWDKKITYNAPLARNGALSVKNTIEYLIQLGASKSKLVLGIPLYGRTFITNTTGNFNDPSNDVGFQGIYTRENGFMGYNEICLLLTNKSSGWSEEWDSSTSQAVAKCIDKDEGETKVAVYDSTRSVANKIRYAMQNELAGAMVWSIDTDDFLGDCIIENNTYADFKPSTRAISNLPKRINSNYPLLRTVNEAIVIALEEISNDKDQENTIPDENGAGNRLTTISFTFLLFIAAIHFCEL